MPARSSSPAPSETEFDVGAALTGGDGTLEAGEAGLWDNGHLDVMAEEEVADDEAVIAAHQAASNRKGTHLKGRTVKKGGGFQAMGLNAHLLKAITRKGFSIPTPIQRKTIPLLLNDKDVVGMARTGSGKTAAFVIPMIEKLKVHSSKVGARALILSPSRELALQTLQVVKELGRGTDLKSVLLVGGDSLEEQFSAMTGNPDVVIATPGRFLHLKVEMNLDLSSMRYVVFDEADRLFEMGFAAQLTEILYSLPPSRQTLLFSATLPKSLVEFARAGLQDPVLVRLDADSKISPDLQSAFFTVKSSEKEGGLLHLLQNVINIPTRSQLVSSSADVPSTAPGQGKKRKRPGPEDKGAPGPSPFSTIVFAATKHHVEYLAQLLRMAGYAVSYVYGSLDQTARKSQVQAFRSGQSNILVVTDVAARGIDIPILANVINYDFPSQPKIYVHRVGRTARAGQKGWSYSLVRDADTPYLLDLQLFLGRTLSVGRVKGEVVNHAQDVVVGSCRQEQLQAACEWVNQFLDNNVDLAALRTVALKGEKQYQRTRNSASLESAKRAKTLLTSASWTELHPLFDDAADDLEVEREKMLARVGGFRPQESIFEIGARRGGRRNNEEAVDALRKIRSGFESRKRKAPAPPQAPIRAGDEQENTQQDVDLDSDPDLDDAVSQASSSELEVTFTTAHPRKKGLQADEDSHAYRDPENFMSYHPSSTNLSDDRAYGVHSGSNRNDASFVEAARSATMDLGLDEGGKNFGEARGVMRWDKRHKKYVRRENDDDGSKVPGKLLVRGESGAKIAASFRSGRFEKWKKQHRVGRFPAVGDSEAKAGSAAGEADGPSAKRFRHRSSQQPKMPDKFRGDFEKQKLKAAGARERAAAMGMSAKGPKELKSVDRVVKDRHLKQKRREKNARPRRKGRG